MSDTYIAFDRIVSHWPYRTAQVTDCMMTLDRGEQKVLEDKLAEAAGVRVDNHTVYGIIAVDGSAIYLEFSDLAVYVGLKVAERSW